MKKYTNKILWITILVLIVFSCGYLTIRLQTVHHQHPEYFLNKQSEDALFNSPKSPEPSEAPKAPSGTAEQSDTSTINVY